MIPESQMIRVWKESVRRLKRAAAYQDMSMVRLLDRLSQEECARLQIVVEPIQRVDKRFKTQKD